MKVQWLGRLVFVLVSVLVVWNLYKGLTVQEVGVPGFTIKFGTPARDSPSNARGSEISGAWRYDLLSDVSNVPKRGALDLTVDGQLVSGVMDNPDPERPGERSAVHGTYIADALTLQRETNRQGIIQEYRIIRRDGGFSGSFQNVGQLEGRYKDSGKFSIHR
jgi:hypothetical protein